MVVGRSRGLVNLLLIKEAGGVGVGVGVGRARGISTNDTRRSIISNTLLEILACPLSKQPLRVCEESKSLISHHIGVSYPIVDGIPCLVPTDGKFIQDTQGGQDSKS